MTDWSTWGGDVGESAAVYGAASLVILSAVTSWLANLFSLPGNWLVVLIAALAMLFAPTFTGDPLVGGVGVGILAGLAVLGEVLEFAAGAAGAAKQGASKRSIWLSLFGAMAGSIGGAMAGIPVPVFGPLIGAVLGGGGGAFAGAYFGESTRGTAHNERVQISKAAFFGRLLGTAGKLLVGAVMLVVLVVATVV